MHATYQFRGSTTAADGRRIDEREHYGITKGIQTFTEIIFWHAPDNSGHNCEIVSASPR